MAKQSTVMFRTLGADGPAKALHLLKMQGFVEAKSVRILSDVLHVDHPSQSMAEVYPAGATPMIQVVAGIVYQARTKMTPADARAFALALLKAADLADEMAAPPRGRKGGG